MTWSLTWLEHLGHLGQESSRNLQNSWKHPMPSRWFLQVRLIFPWLSSQKTAPLQPALAGIWPRPQLPPKRLRSLAGTTQDVTWLTSKKRCFTMSYDLFMMFWGLNIFFPEMWGIAWTSRTLYPQNLTSTVGVIKCHGRSAGSSLLQGQ